MTEALWYDALGVPHRRVMGTARIVSLVPSLTETLFAFSLGEAVVGRTGFCIHPAEVKGVPKVGGTKDVRLDRLFALEPTHVIANVDENRREQVEAIAAAGIEVIVTHPCRLEDNVALFRLLGGIFDREDAAEYAVEAFTGALLQARSIAAELPPERVLYPIWREPWMTVASSTWISAMLEAVGWQTWPAIEEPRYPVIDEDAVRQAGIARVLLPSEPYRFTEAHGEEARRLLGADVPVTLVDGEMVSWYGTRAISGLCYLAALRQDLAGPRSA
ncbi:MAG: ABC transporter substrate-binding protein [Rhodocyclales bacterium]|nr:ABC transporter substrate-binding protein [Rhodocyclales bacterium]